MVHGKKRIPYWIDRRLNGLAGPEYDATISFGLPFEPEDSQYGEYRFLGFRLADGTSVVRSFWMDSGELSRGIMTDPTVATSVRRALSNE